MKTSTIQTSLLTFIVLLGLFAIADSLTSLAFGQPAEAAPVPVTVVDTDSPLQAYFDAASGKYGWLIAVVLAIGTARLIVKPLMTFLHAVAAATASKKDDALLEKVERSKAYTTFLFVLDWVASIKVKK